MYAVFVGAVLTPLVVSLLLASQAVGFGAITAVITLVIGLIGGFTSAFGVIGKQRQQVTELWKETAEARAAETAQVQKQLNEVRAENAQTKARMDLMVSDFAKQIGEACAHTIVDIVREELPHG